MQAVELYRTMSRIRAFEERVAFHFREGAVQGFVHISVGQEAVAAGVCAALDERDYITTTHRGHGHCLAKGADPVGMMAELFGRETGLCGGRGGSMHLADPRLGILGANGIVGAGLPLAVGAALSSHVTGDGRITVAFFGEGAVHTGAFHEALTLAVAWGLPVVFVCESNGWVEFTPIDRWRGPTLVDRAASYGLPSQSVDGGDAEAVRDMFAETAAACRAGAGPSFVEARTVRGSGHYEGDAQHYRDEKQWAELDPLARFRRLELVDTAVVDEIDTAAAAEMDAAVEEALRAPYPDPSTALDNVYAQ